MQHKLIWNSIYLTLFNASFILFRNYSFYTRLFGRMMTYFFYSLDLKIAHIRNTRTIVIILVTNILNDSFGRIKVIILPIHHNSVCNSGIFSFNIFVFMGIWSISSSTLTVIIFLHYRVAAKMALEILGYTMCNRHSAEFDYDGWWAYQ